MTLLRIAALAILSSPLASTASATPSVVPTMPVSALRAGQKAVVRTVFVGDSIETFEAEIVGVVPGGRAEGDMILARATSERVVHVGVAQGMSGSPVYVDGKLIGALSSGWGFSKDPVFGITPIGEMLAVLDAVEPASTERSVGPTGVDAGRGSGRARFGPFRWPDDEGVTPERPEDAEAWAASGRLSLPVSTSGLHPAARALVRAALEPFGLSVTPGGGGAARSPGPARIEPGSSVSVDLLRGDLNLAAIGTVTYVDGDRVLLFGHPFFQSGDIRLPLSSARITTILASLNNSFKLGVPGGSIGTATQDRRAAVAGRLGSSPRLMPVVLDLMASGRPRKFRFECIEDRSLAPTLIGTAVANSLLESGGTSPQQSVRWSMTMHRQGTHPLVLWDVAAGDAPLQDLLLALSTPLRYLWNNPFERVAFDSIGIRIDVEPGRNVWTVRSMSVPRSSVRPGGTVRLTCELENWRGARVVRQLDLAVPRELPDGRYPIWAGGGAEWARLEATRLPGRYRPLSLGEAWRRLGELRPSDSIYAAIWAKAPELSADGEDLPELPNSALAMLSPATTAGDRSRRGDWAVMSEARQREEGVVRGEFSLEFSVDSKAP